MTPLQPPSVNPQPPSVTPQPPSVTPQPRRLPSNCRRLPAKCLRFPANRVPSKIPVLRENKKKPDPYGRSPHCFFRRRMKSNGVQHPHAVCHGSLPKASGCASNLMVSRRVFVCRCQWPICLGPAALPQGTGLPPRLPPSSCNTVAGGAKARSGRFGGGAARHTAPAMIACGHTARCTRHSAGGG